MANGRSQSEFRDGSPTVSAGSTAASAPVSWERTAGHPVTQALMALVPWPVSGFVAGLNALLARRADRRLRLWRETVGEQVAHLEINKVDREFLGSMAFEELLTAALDSVQRTRAAETIPYQVAVLLGAVRLHRPPDIDPAALLSVLEQLAAAEIDVARLIWEATRHGGSFLPDLQQELIREIPGLDFYCGRLAAVGLIERDPLTRYDIPQAYRATSGFRALMSVAGDMGVNTAGGGEPAE